MPKRTPPLYRKCKDCHLFVDENPSYEDAPDEVAEFVHLYGECDLCVETAESHNAIPEDGPGHPIRYWRAFGPPAMVARFEPLPGDVILASQRGDEWDESEE